MARALSSILLITVSAVVVLVAAVVVLTIFGTGISPVSTASSQATSCLVQARSTCITMGTLPSGWSTLYSDGQTCASATGCPDCPCVLGSGGTREGTGQGPESTSTAGNYRLYHYKVGE
jgi:hypothetical protein